MRRDEFLKSLAALAAAGALPLSARAAANVKMMSPANPGGGWDTTGRALGKALTDAKVADSVTYDNKGGAAGALGLAQFRGLMATQWHYLMAASTTVIVPTLLLFMLAQRYFVRGVVLTGLKG